MVMQVDAKNQNLTALITIQYVYNMQRNRSHKKKPVCHKF